MKEVVIDFPAQDEAQNQKLIKLLDDLQDVMNTEIVIETMTIIRVKYDGMKVELGSILQRLAGNKTGLRPATPKKYSSKIKPLRISDEPLEKGIDPLGS